MSAMQEPISFGELDVEIVGQMEEARGNPDPETPFRIAILGDFSGRANRGIIDTDIADRRTIMVDRDNIDGVLNKLNVEIVLSLMGKEAPPVRIKFSGMDDFHPDSLFNRLDIFEALRDTRQGIKDPITFASFVKEFQQPAESPSKADTNKPVEKMSEQTTGSFLDQVLEETETKPSKSGESRGTSEWDNFLRQIVQPQIVPDIEPQQAKIIASIDAATAEFMRMVLHHPDFQALEAAWRAVHFLVSRVETDENLKLYIIDISKDELADDLAEAVELSSTGLYKLLVEQTVSTFGGEPWALLTGNYYFDNGYDDVNILGRLTKIAWASGAPFIAGASEKILGCGSLHETPDPGGWQKPRENKAWDSLRKLPETPYLGLALPRFLLRLPYGEDTDPIESFEFEEMPYASIHNLYLWGNASIACAYLIAEAFSRNEWNLRPGSMLDIENLPLHLYKEAGEPRTKPCAEVVFTEEAAELILEKGVMPLLSFKNQDRVRLARFQSLADPPVNLAGRWG
jgi:type VI secretion system protein ImpC